MNTVMSLADDLAKSIVAQDKKPRGVGITLFLAQRDEIKDALEKGYSQKLIWEHLNLKKAMPVSYQTFSSYIFRYITEKKTVASEPISTTPVTTTNLSREARKPMGIVTGKSSAFGGDDDVDIKNLLSKKTV